MSTSTVTSSSVGGYRARPESLTLISRLANSAKLLRARTLWRLSVEDTLLKRLTSAFEHMTAKLRPFIQEEDAVVGQRHVARHRHVAPADQPDMRNGVMGGATRADRHPCGAVAGEASDTMDTCGLNGFGQGHPRHDGREPPGQHRLASPRGAEQEEIVVRTPASHSASPWRLGEQMACAVNPLSGATVWGRLMTALRATPWPPGGRRSQTPR
jgi:hypothetical protein